MEKFMKKENYLKLLLISGLMLLIITMIMPSQVICQNYDNETVSNDDTEYENEEVEDSEEYAEDEESYVPPVNDLEEMQKRINQINQDPTTQAAEVFNQVQGGNSSGVVSQLTEQMGKDSSFSSPLYWFFMIFISVVGMGFFWSGKRNGDALFMISGATMSIFPYFVTNMWIFALLSVALIVLPFYLRRF